MSRRPTAPKVTAGSRLQVGTSRSRSGSTKAGFFALVAFVTVGIVTACSEPPKLVGEGAGCAVTTDCALGLVCVPQKAGRICTGDVTSIARATPQPSIDAGRDGDAPEGGEAGEGGPIPGDSAIPTEAEVDSSPPVDANPPVDSSAD